MAKNKALKSFIGCFILLLDIFCCSGVSSTYASPYMPSADPTLELINQSQTASLKVIQDIPLPGTQGRIDHMAFDPKSQRLLVAAYVNNSLEVVDVKLGKRIQSIIGLHGPQGISFVPEYNRIFLADEDGSVLVLDGSSLKSLESTALSPDADNIRYDASAKRIYIGYGSGALGVLDARSGEHLGDIKLAGHPESFQLEASGPRIFINVPTASQIAVADREKMMVIATWPILNSGANFPMALDEPGHRLFVGCRMPAGLLVYNTTSGKQVAALSLDDDSDDIFYDASMKRIYASCGQGFIDVFEQQGPDHYVSIARIATRQGARTSLFIPDLSWLCLAMPKGNSQDAEIRIYSTKT